MNADSSRPMAAWLESAWLARYLDRQLDADETAWFEAYLLDKPELLEMVETDNALRDALAKARPLLNSGGTGATRENATGVALRNAFPLRGAASIAAALLLGVGLGGVLAHRNERAMPQFIADPPHVVYDTQRGLPVAPTVEHADSSGDYAFVEVAVPSAAQNVRIVLGDGSQHALAVSADGFVGFLLARSTTVAASSAILHYELDGKDFDRTLSINTANEGVKK